MSLERSPRMFTYYISLDCHHSNLEQEQPHFIGKEADCSSHLLKLTQLMNDSTAASVQGFWQYALTIVPLDPETGKRADNSNDSLLNK